jgi:hypothetical protein
VTSKSAITPSFKGWVATVFPGVRPIIRLAAKPTDTMLSALGVYGDYRGLGERHAPYFDEHQRVSRARVYSDVWREQSAE